LTGFAVGDDIYGVTNPQFCGAQAEYAVASAAMITPKPRNLNHRKAASAPVVAVTAWQMLFEYAQAKSGETLIITGAAGNVGAYAVQLALHNGIRVVAVERPHDEAFLRTLGVEKIVDSSSANFEAELPQIDAVLDLVGGSTVRRIVGAIKPGGKLVSVVSQQPTPQRKDIQSVFFYAEVTTQRLQTLTDLFERGIISPQVGSVLPMSQARHAHKMLAGAPHAKGKIVLEMTAETNRR
jgi:NADPH:quinone reductase-like Zn-dependent oxidoreductase